MSIANSMIETELPDYIFRVILVVVPHATHHAKQCVASSQSPLPVLRGYMPTAISELTAQESTCYDECGQLFQEIECSMACSKTANA